MFEVLFGLPCSEFYSTKMSQAVGSGNEQLPPSTKNKTRFSLLSDTAFA